MRLMNKHSPSQLYTCVCEEFAAERNAMCTDVEGWPARHQDIMDLKASLYYDI